MGSDWLTWILGLMLLGIVFWIILMLAGGGNGNTLYRSSCHTPSAALIVWLAFFSASPSIFSSTLPF
jgi:hypothetical protein